MALALSFYETHYRSLDTTLAMGLRNMFVILFKQQRIAEAEPYLTRALEIGERVFPQSWKMAQLRFGQALLEQSRGKFQESATILRQVIDLQERILGSEHPELARSLLAYSFALRHLHRRNEAHEAQKRGDSILKSFQ
jgi:tetratricopeptide (TPR) repeat protein